MLGSLVGERIELNAGAHAPSVLAPSAATPEADAAGAYRAFLEVHLDETYRLATFILGQRADAEDAVHDAAIAAWRHWPDRRDPIRTEAWFRRIVVNACRDRFRAAQRVRRINAIEALQAGSDRVAADHAERVAEQDRIGRQLAKLGIDERVLLTLRFGLDLTVPAIAATLRVPEGTVKSRLHRATESLRRGLEAQDGTPSR